MVNRLPPELFEAVIKLCVDGGPKNAVLQLRLVSRDFDRILKPYILQTIALDFSRMSKTSSRPAPQLEALQTVREHCNSLSINMMLLADRNEDVDSEDDDEQFRMEKATFTAKEYHKRVKGLLNHCRGIERLRLKLPPLTAEDDTSAATIILGNTFKALAERPAKGSTVIKVLVLEDLPDTSIRELWNDSEADIKMMRKVVESVEHLVLTLRRHEVDEELREDFGSGLWDMTMHSGRLKSLCLKGGLDYVPFRRIRKSVRSGAQDLETWWEGDIPILPQCVFGGYADTLMCLELKQIEVTADTFLHIMTDWCGSIEELYLNEVYLMVNTLPGWDPDGRRGLWVGFPNVRPDADEEKWMAMELRDNLKGLRFCRASKLGYHRCWSGEANVPEMGFDFQDPCGLGRSLDQRFVEIVMGYRQPKTPRGKKVVYLPPLWDDEKVDDHVYESADDDDDFSATIAAVANAMNKNDDEEDVPLDFEEQAMYEEDEDEEVYKNTHRDRAYHYHKRPRKMRAIDWDANAYQTVVANRTSCWLNSIDGRFANPTETRHKSEDESDDE